MFWLIEQLVYSHKHVDNGTDDDVNEDNNDDDDCERNRMQHNSIRYANCVLKFFICLSNWMLIELIYFVFLCTLNAASFRGHPVRTWIIGLAHNT